VAERKHRFRPSVKFWRARRAVPFLLLLVGLLGVTTLAWGQFSTQPGNAVGTVACNDTIYTYGWPDGNGDVLKCVSNVWTLVTQPATAAGSTGYVQFDNAGLLAGSSNLFWDNTNYRLGIGTATPKSALDVSGGVAIGTGYAGITAAPTSGVIVQGNVGIGVASPGAKLEVDGTFGNGPSSDNGIFIANAATNDVALQIGNYQTSPYGMWLQAMYPKNLRAGTFPIILNPGGGKIGIATTAPNASALLDVYSTTLGFLPPRMNSTQEAAISSPAAGLTVYNTALSELDVTTAPHGKRWVPIPCNYSPLSS
jgi:hypothetical protein